MINLLKKIPVYIKIYNNKIEITNLVTGDTVSGLPVKKFSTDRIVISDFNIIQELIRSLLKELFLIKSFLPLQLKILMQQMEKVDGGLSELEKRGLRDLAEQAGGVYVALVDHTRKLSADEALSELIYSK